VAVSASALEITVQDDGCGFNAADRSGTQPGDGLGNMAKRVKDLGGQFQIVSSPGQGTRVTFIVPLPVGAAPGVSHNHAVELTPKSPSL
jgi:signal transduction histidine kinase